MIENAHNIVKTQKALKNMLFLMWGFIIIDFSAFIIVFISDFSSIYLKIVILSVMSIFSFFVFWVISKIINPALNNDFSNTIFCKTLYSNFQLQNNTIDQAVNILKDISDNKVTSESIEDFKNSGALGQSVSLLYTRLEHIAEDERKRAWSINGIAKFGQLLRENLNSNRKDIAYLFISELVKYINANQGALYLIDEEDNGGQYLNLVACYAYKRKKHHEQKFEINDGLLGQCILEKNTILVTDIPEDYTKITSGLGESTPNCIVIVPIKINEEILGVIELAAFEVFPDYKVELIQKTAENFASIYASIKNNGNMQKLLDASQHITAELRAKENALLQNEEELQAAQENLNHKLIELMAESNLTKSIIAAINKSNASIQFDMNGNILDANEMFISMLGYTKNEIIGLNETVFIPKDELDSARYSMLWESLRQGVFNSGEFRRISKEGKEIWMDVTYNPILDLNEKPFKILMLAVFTTEAKVRENEHKNKLIAINEAMAFVELNTDLTIKSANQYFLNKLNIKRKDLKDTTFIKLITNRFNTKEVVMQVELALSEGQNLHQTLTVLSSENVAIVFDMSLSAARDINGTLCNYYVILNENKTISRPV